MHKDYGMIVCEEICESYIGAAVGAGVGAAGGATVWASKRLKLKKLRKECGEHKDKSKRDACRKQIDLKISRLAKRALVYGAAATAGGAAVGATPVKAVSNVGPLELGGGAALAAGSMKVADILRKKREKSNK